jgi:hypothetical protein
MFLNSKCYHVNCWILLKPVAGEVDDKLQFQIPFMNMLIPNIVSYAVLGVHLGMFISICYAVINISHAITKPMYSTRNKRDSQQ